MKRRKSRRMPRQFKLAIEGLIVTAIGFAAATQLQGPHHMIGAIGCVIAIGYLILMILSESVMALRNLRHLRELRRIQEKGERRNG
jgi:hypothetical protein